MSKVTTINWFRNDLRLSDNPALHKAAKDGSVLAVYILDDENSHDQQLGEASRCWLNYSLQDLNKQLQGKYGEKKITTEVRKPIILYLSPHRF